MMKSSNTNVSILERPKVEIASMTEQTIGSPRKLNEVLSKIGQPVRSKKCSSKPCETLIRRLRHRLNTS